MKQTAVEFLIKQLNINGTVIPMAIEYKAKEMEQQQIIDAYQTAEKDCGKDFLHGDLYYHEIYVQTHIPKHYRVWFPDSMEEEGGFWWNAVTDSFNRLYEINHPIEDRDTVQWYIDNGYKVEEV
jgi:hypothetical protein